MVSPDHIQDALAARDLSARIQAARAEGAAAQTANAADSLDIARIVLEHVIPHRIGPMLDGDRLIPALQDGGYMEPDEDRGDLGRYLDLAVEAVKAKATSERSIADSLSARHDEINASLADDSAAQD